MMSACVSVTKMAQEARLMMMKDDDDDAGW